MTEKYRNKVLAVIGEIAEGSTLKKSLEKQGLSSGYFFKCLEKDLELDELYARARKYSTESMIDEIKDIADDQLLDPNRARNQIQVRQWSMAKLNPSKYGERIDVNVSAQIDLKGVLARLDAPIPHPINVVTSQVIDVIAHKDDKQTGCEPVSPQSDSDVDIFD